MGLDGRAQAGPAGADDDDVVLVSGVRQARHQPDLTPESRSRVNGPRPKRNIARPAWILGDGKSRTIRDSVVFSLPRPGGGRGSAPWPPVSRRDRSVPPRS